MIIKNNSKEVKLDIKSGDIFYSNSLGSYNLLTAIGGVHPSYQYSLISLSQNGSFYSSEYARLPLEFIKDMINEEIEKGELIHYSSNKYEFELNINNKW